MKRLALAAITIAILALPAVAQANQASAYVLRTAHAARQLQADYHRLRIIWNTASNAEDYNAAVTFYEQLEGLLYHAAPQPTGYGFPAEQPEEMIWLYANEFPSDVQLIELDFEPPINESGLKTAANGFDQDVASYNANVRQLWALAAIPNPPVLSPY